MKTKNSLYLVLLLSLFGCKKSEGDCGKPTQENDPIVSVNLTSGTDACNEVSEGFELDLSWPYITNGKEGGYQFSFKGTEGFDIKEGNANARENSNITLIARDDSPENATIEVFAYNDCGESNRGAAVVKVRKTLPYAVNTRINLPDIISRAATFIYGGKAYIAGGNRSTPAGTEKTWIYDPANNNIEQLPAIFSGGEESAAVIGDTAYLCRDGGRNFEVYHIPTHTKVREMNQSNPFNDPAGHLISSFAIGNKLYYGPISLLASIYSYDVTTGVFKSECHMQNAAGYACKASFYLNNHIYCFFENGFVYDFNSSTNEVSLIITNFALDENIVTSFAVEGNGYVVTNKNYYLYAPVNNLFNKIEVFNGKNCYSNNWNGHGWSTSNFVIGDRVYFIGGKDTENDPPHDDFTGVRF